MICERIFPWTVALEGVWSGALTESSGVLLGRVLLATGFWWGLTSNVYIRSHLPVIQGIGLRLVSSGHYLLSLNMTVTRDNRFLPTVTRLLRDDLVGRLGLVEGFAFVHL